MRVESQGNVYAHPSSRFALHQKLVRGQNSFFASPFVKDELAHGVINRSELAERISNSFPVNDLPVDEYGGFSVGDRVYIWKVWAIRRHKNPLMRVFKSEADCEFDHLSDMRPDFSYRKIIIVTREEERHLQPY